MHQPFPSSEIFRCLTYREELLRGMLCADHIGFHLASYGFVVMSHENNVLPGIATSTQSVFDNLEYFLGNLATLAGGTESVSARRATMRPPVSKRLGQIASTRTVPVSSVS